MERFIIASFLLLLASTAAVEGRMGRAAVFDNSMPANHHALIGGDELATACNQVAGCCVCACRLINQSILGFMDEKYCSITLLY